MSQHFLQVEHLTKRFPASGQSDGLTVFEDVNFAIDRGEFVCIIGHSGCGKSTIMNSLSGLDSPSGGDVIMDGREISGPSLERGVVFQNYSLLPWLSTVENIMFGVRARWPNWSRAKIREHSLEYLDLVGLKNVAHRKPGQLSGGMRQRVSIARAFATQPKLLLLDEPFGALDALTRGVIQDELVSICSQTQQTVFMITHDVDEAIFLADRVLLMSNGPQAVIAEDVTIDLPRPRTRGEIINEPGYYTIRNHLLDFLVNRSKEARTQTPSARPAVINPVKADTPTRSGSETRAIHA